MPMSELELLTVLKGQIQDSIKYHDSEFRDTNLEIDNAYRQKPYGNENPKRSQVISSDVYDSVEGDMPPLARIFLGPTEIMKFIPTLGEQDKEEADQKTKYANFLIRGQKESYKVLHDLLKEPGKALCSIAYYYVEEIEAPEYHFYENLSELEMTSILTTMDAESGVDRVDVEVQNEYKTDTLDAEGNPNESTFDVRFKAVRKRSKITIKAVPPENFIMSRGAECKESAMLIGHDMLISKGELVSRGYSKDVVMDLPVYSETKGNQEKKQRFEKQGGWDHYSGYHWTNDEVLLETLYAKIDVDEDGIPERRMIVKCRDKILENEPYGIAPYAIFSQLLEPHAAIGLSRGLQAARYQEEKTALKRGLMDNTYSANRPRLAVDDSEGQYDGGKVDLDDALNKQLDGIIRVDGPPQNALFPIVTPYTGDKALMTIQYVDQEKAQTLGNQMASQGLDADKLYRETATRFEGVEEAQQAKLELVARNYAETGFRDLFEGVIWLAQHYQDEVVEVMVTGKPLTVDPRRWKYEHYCMSQVGLGAGDSKDVIANLGALLQLALGLIEQGAPVMDWDKLYNILEDMVRVMGKADVARYFNDPSQPAELLQAQNMQLQKAVQELQQWAQTQGSMAAAEAKKADASLEGKKMDTAFKSDEGERNHKVKMRELDQKDREIEVDARKTQVEILSLISKIQETKANTTEQELENSATVSGLRDLLEAAQAAQGAVGGNA